MTDQTQGNQGNQGNPGEASRGGSGGQGGQGGTGVQGRRGLQGEQGERGRTGPGFSSWLTRNLVRAYVLLWAGVILSFGLSSIRDGRALDKINAQARAQCEAGNARSDVQRDDFVESAAMTNQIDLEKLFGIDAAQAAEFRRLSTEAAERRIARLPYLDCATGQRVSPPAPAATTRP